MRINKLIALVTLTLIGCETASLAEENNSFTKKHPRRAEVLRRANHEKGVNNADAVAGKITDKQARKLNREDNAIKREEQADAAANGGSITKGEQRDLNRQENRVNRQRLAMEKRDAAKKAGQQNSSGNTASTPVNQPPVQTATPTSN